jgi:hypothetical protein
LVAEEAALEPPQELMVVQVVVAELMDLIQHLVAKEFLDRVMMEVKALEAEEEEVVAELVLPVAKHLAMPNQVEMVAQVLQIQSLVQA